MCTCIDIHGSLTFGTCDSNKPLVILKLIFFHLQAYRHTYTYTTNIRRRPFYADCDLIFDVNIITCTCIYLDNTQTIH